MGNELAEETDIRTEQDELARDVIALITSGRSSIDAASLEDLEDALISADLGTTAAAAIAARVKSHKFDGDITAQALALALLMV